jgi:hypothetical protein
MKRFASLLAIAALLASACSTSSTPSGGSQGTPVNGGSMTVGLDGDMVLADPALVSDGNSLYVAAQVVQGLVGLQPGTISTIIPVLASALPTVSADGKTYTFTLRTGVKFSDGTPFNATAVKFNYDRWKAFPKGDLQDNDYYYGAVFGGFGDASNIVSVTADDAANTAVFTLKNPQSNFLLSQTLQVFGIESPTALQTMNADTTPIANNKYAQGSAAEDMIGTGPFMFKEWVVGDHVTVVKNPNYWDTANAAHLDTIIFKSNLGDSTAKLQARDDRSGRHDFRQEFRPCHHRPRPVLQPGLPGPEPEPHKDRRRDHLRGQERSARGRLRPEQAAVHRLAVRRPGQGPPELDAVGHCRLQGRDTPDLRRHEGQGRPHGCQPDLRPDDNRPLLPLQRSSPVHARSQD